MDSTDYILFVPMFFLAIYLWLESQDFGVAIVAPMVAQNEEERKTALNLLKPGLDGNEAWAFLCAGVTGALFSNGRFNIPESTFWPLGIILTGMIVRLAAAFWGNIFQQPLLLRGVRFITIINVISAGVLALELANRDLFTTTSPAINLQLSRPLRAAFSFAAQTASSTISTPTTSLHTDAISCAMVPVPL